VYLPRWEGWMQLLDYIKSYEGGVAMTMGEVALAQGYDNAPTVPNPGQADSDADGIGDVIEGAGLDAAAASLSRNVAGELSATLTNGAGNGVAGQPLEFTFDRDGDGADETYQATTNSDGVATVTVTATRAVGAASYTVAWDGLRGVTASDTGTVDVADATTITLDATNPASGQVTDGVALGATLVDTDGSPLDNRTVTFTVGAASATATTDAAGHATATVTLAGPVGVQTVQAAFAGAGQHGASSDTGSLTVTREDTTLALADAVASKNADAVARATLTEADGATLAGRTVTFLIEQKVRNQTMFVQMGTAQTNASGVASFTVPSKYVSKSRTNIRASFAGDGSFLGSQDDAQAYRN
jgi:hypothetical protein